VRGAGVKIGIVTAVAAAVVVALWMAPRATRFGRGDLAPDLPLPSHGGGPSGVTKFRGKVVLLVPFSSTCRPCVAGLSDLEKLHREYLRRGLTVLGVLLDPDPQAAAPLLAEHKITFIVLDDPGGAQIRRVYGLTELPEIYLIDTQGRVAEVYLEPVEWRDRKFRARVDELLPPPRPEERR
jgi:peroxiredoxin